MTQFSDLDLARKTLLEEDHALVIVKDGELLFTSRETSIRPIYRAVKELGEALKGASVADKVIGKAAALFCTLAQVKSVYAVLISEIAIETLLAAGIELEYQKSCPYILNRSRDGMCPVEKLAVDVEDGRILLEKVGKFLGDIQEG
ncbi:MAG: DUF1893 domain-containing protein [Firmicutes bacterium]|nr:DUF1893 domain-containing protein [Bacillota bacterium]